MTLMLNGTAGCPQDEGGRAMSMLRPIDTVIFLPRCWLSGAPLYAQPSKGPPNALQGFSQNHDQPVHIEAATLEVRDKDKVATFSGDVKVKQGDTGMRCKSLVVFYEQNGADAGKARACGPPPRPRRSAAHQAAGSARRRSGDAKEQTATGETGVFDMKTNTVTLNGKVVMTQGQNVLRGDRLVVDLTSGVSRVESGKNGKGRVQGLFLPGSGAPDLKPGRDGRAAPRAAVPIDPKRPRSRSGRPRRRGIS